MQFGSYPTITNVANRDTLLLLQASSGAVKQAAVEDVTKSATSGVINVKDYGAVGDGSTDDSVAIAEAIAAATPGQAVFFPNSSGAYIITAPIVTAAQGIKIFGNGAVISGLSWTQFQFLRFSGAAQCVVEGLTFFGNSPASATSLGLAHIEVIDSTDITIRNCWFNTSASSGVWVTGACSHVSIVGNRFTGNFCAIFSDDNTVSQPTFLLIANNVIEDGLSATSKVNYSGGIKVSGVGTANTTAGHSITGNVITRPGQMGIEIQGQINDCTISGNSVNDADFGISVSDSLRATVSGNSVKAASNYGIEVASNSAGCAVSGNTIDGHDAGGSRVTDVGISISGSSDCTATGNVVRNFSGTGIQTFICNNITITGNTIRSQEGNGVLLQGSYTCSVCSNIITSVSNSMRLGVIIDASGSTGAYAGFTICNNTFKSDFTYVIIRLYSGSGSAAIKSVLISGNNASNANGAGGAFDIQFGGSTSYVDNLVIKDNLAGTISDNFQYNHLNAPVWRKDYTGLAPQAVDTMLVDASGGNQTVSLPLAVRAYGMEMCIKKTDATGNTVAFALSGGDSTDAVALAVQNAFVRVKSDGASKWQVIAKG